MTVVTSIGVGGGSQASRVVWCGVWLAGGGLWCTGCSMVSQQLPLVRTPLQFSPARPLLSHRSHCHCSLQK